MKFGPARAYIVQLTAIHHAAPTKGPASDEWNLTTIQGRLGVSLEALVEFAYDGWHKILGIEDVRSVTDIGSRLNNDNLCTLRILRKTTSDHGAGGPTANDEIVPGNGWHGHC